MAENSVPWGGIVTGDCGPYSDDVWSDFWREMFVSDNTTQGIVRGYANSLEPTTAGGNVLINTGAALVDGKFYRNTASISTAIPVPVVSTRYDRMVLLKLWATQEVRLARLAGVEGAGAPPSYLARQTDSVEWAIPICTVVITTLGAITIVDERHYCQSRAALDYQYLALANQVSGGWGVGMQSFPVPMTITLSPGTWMIGANLAGQFWPGIPAAQICFPPGLPPGYTTIGWAAFTPVAVAADSASHVIGLRLYTFTDNTQIELCFGPNNANTVLYGEDSLGGTDLYAFRVA